jgi:hypothetical protein
MPGAAVKEISFTHGLSMPAAGGYSSRPFTAAAYVGPAVQEEANKPRFGVLTFLEFNL